MGCPRCGAAVGTDGAAVSRCPACGYDLAADDRASVNAIRRSPVAQSRQRSSVIRPIKPLPKRERAAASAEKPTAPRKSRSSVIRPIKPLPKPKRPTARVATHATPDTQLPLAEPAVPETPDTTATPVPIDLPNRITLHNVSGVMPRQLMRLEGRVLDAQYALGRGDHAAARASLKSALAVNDMPDMIWLFLAGLAETRAEQRDCLEETLARNPQNQIAIEAILRLDGRLSLTEGAPGSDAADDGLEPGEVAARRMACPTCGGSLSYNVQEKLVACYACGQRIVDADDLARTQPSTMLQIGLVKRKYAAQPWNIGGRWLRCTSCGAITTLSRLTLTNTCRFCDSNHIVQEGAHLPFDQPDLIVPFTVDEHTAQAHIRQHLSSGMRRITRLFADAVTRIELRGVYLPFWVFEAIMDVKWSWTNAPDHGHQPVLLDDVLHFAAETPDARLLRRLEPFDVRSGVDYDPRLLAEYPAELYTRDVDRASLDVRTRLTSDAEQHARPGLLVRRPTRGHSGSYGLFTTGSGDNNNPGRLKLHATTRSLSYRFGLLPVWFGRLIESDGDTQPVLVNGQTGEVILGDVEKITS